MRCPSYHEYRWNQYSDKVHPNHKIRSNSIHHLRAWSGERMQVLYTVLCCHFRTTLFHLKQEPTETQMDPQNSIILNHSKQTSANLYTSHLAKKQAKLIECRELITEGKSWHMKHPTWFCLIFKSERHSTLSISCSFLRQLQRAVCSPVSFSSRKATNMVHFKCHQGFRMTVASQLSALEEFWKQVKSYFPGTFHLLHYLLSSIMSLMSSISPHSQCLWLCTPGYQGFSVFPFSCFHLHFHPVFRPSVCDSTFSQTNFALLLWCCESRENQVATDKCSVACHFS